MASAFIGSVGKVELIALGLKQVQPIDISPADAGDQVGFSRTILAPQHVKPPAIVTATLPKSDQHING